MAALTQQLSDLKSGIGTDSSSQDGACLPLHLQPLIAERCCRIFRVVADAEAAVVAEALADKAQTLSDLSSKLQALHSEMEELDVASAEQTVSAELDALPPAPLAHNIADEIDSLQVN